MNEANMAKVRLLGCYDSSRHSYRDGDDDPPNRYDLARANRHQQQIDSCRSVCLPDLVSS